MSALYVRQQYGVKFRRGERVVLHDHAACPTADDAHCDDTSRDRYGVIVSFPGQYVGVRFDGEKRTTPCHPTWRLRSDR